jgi:hypothetical protein
MPMTEITAWITRFISLLLSNAAAPASTMLQQVSDNFFASLSFWIFVDLIWFRWSMIIPFESNKLYYYTGKYEYLVPIHSSIRKFDYQIILNLSKESKELNQRH